MRTDSQLKFAPVKFDICGFSGSLGSKGGMEIFLRSPLSQNIIYSVFQKAKTVNEIADNLGVSPVYIEGEAEYLAEYGFLTKNNDRFLCNILLSEQTSELVDNHDEMYLRASELFANKLYDVLINSGILNEVICRQTDLPLTLTSDDKTDVNFVLWSLIPYLAAVSGQSLIEQKIPFEQAATHRTDGAFNICYASIASPDVKEPLYMDSMRCWFGPCWLSNKSHILWTIDSEWSDKRLNDNSMSSLQHTLDLLTHVCCRDELLSSDEYAFLIQRGMIKTVGSPETQFRTSLQVVWIPDNTIKDKLLAIGDSVKAELWEQLRVLRDSYSRMVLANTPAHLRIMAEYANQYIFFSDGWFVLHCIQALLKNGRLRLPTEGQSKSLTTLLLPAN